VLIKPGLVAQLFGGQGGGMRIGILGGSFDPVHRGHLGVAGAVADALGLERVLFLPAAQAPLREAAVRASGAQRLEMLRQALDETGDPRFELCELELRRGGISYAVDTLRTLRAEHPLDGFFWILGEDQWARLGNWREPAELARLAEWAVYARPGYGEPTDGMALAGFRVHRVVSAGVWDISSSAVRARLGSGEDVSDWVPDKVIEYIRKSGLYVSY
jgi:nicotinate-nucleotide adenylyltransferase